MAKKTNKPVDYADLTAQIDKKNAEIIAALQKKHGRESVAWLGDSAIQDVGAISTGSLALDAATGIGGMPRGRIIEVFGPYSSGKSSLALATVAEAQKVGLIAGYIDVENAVDKRYAAALGVDVNKLMFSQPPSGEKAFDYALDMVKSGLGIVVIDSVANLVPQAEIDGDMDDHQMMAQAKMINKGLRKLSSPVAQSGAAFVFINQLRDNIGATQWMPQDKTPGGRALPYYASMRFNVKAGEKIKDGDKVIGYYCNVKIAKNKCASPFNDAKIMFINGRGFDRAADTVSAGVEAGVVQQDGATYKWGDVDLGYGYNAVLEKLRADLPMLEDLRTSVMGTMKAARTAAEARP